jgi:Protein of unknown function DUF262
VRLFLLHAAEKERNSTALRNQDTLPNFARRTMLPDFNVKISTLIQDWEAYAKFPSFQRGPVWARRRQQLLIDSILRGWPIPAIMCYRDGSSYMIEDGIQRLSTIRHFVDNNFYTLSEEELKRHEPEEGLESVQPHCKFRGLSDDYRMAFLDYPLHFNEIDKSALSTPEQGVLFRRFQMGQPLTVAENLDSYVSRTTELAHMSEHHAFFNSAYVGYKKQKQAFHMSLYCIALELHGSVTNVRGPELAELASGRYDHLIDESIIHRLDENLTGAARLFIGGTINSRTDIIPIYRAMQILREERIDVHASREGCLVDWYEHAKREPILLLENPDPKTSVVWGGFSRMTEQSSQLKFWSTKRRQLLAQSGLVRLPASVRY